MVMEKLKVNPAKVHGRYVYHAVKRLFDIIASASGLILLSPLFLFEVSINLIQSKHVYNHKDFQPYFFVIVFPIFCIFLYDSLII